VKDAVKKEVDSFRKARHGNGHRGFTLLEIIVTIVIAAIMGVFFVQFVGTGIIHSTDPVLRLQNISRATEVMEKMTAQYKNLAATQSNYLAIFKDFVDYGSETPHPEIRAGYPYFGSYQVIYSGYIKFVSGAEQPETDPSSQKILKVTIRCGDQTVTSLFTR
jgi:prepilin-type N-terminal cleavage/methylation domain-containing protein